MSVRIGLALGLGLALLLAALAGVLLDREPRRIATNSKGIGPELEIPPGREMCQVGERVPEGAASVQLFARRGRGRGGPLAVTLRDPAGTVVAAGRSRSPLGKTVVNVPLTRGDRLETATTVCARNEGFVRVTLLGQRVPSPAGDTQQSTKDSKASLATDAREDPALAPQPPARVGGVRQSKPVSVRLDWYRRTPQSWLEIAPAVARRMGLFKAGFLGAWMPWALLVLVVATGTAAMVLVRRAARG